MTKILIAIPAFNEAHFIGHVLEEISATVRNISILVVNDGSTDDTSKVAQNYNAHIIDHQQNCGKGEAIKTALSSAQNGLYDWVIFLDGDGQHPPRYLPDFIRKIEKNRADVVLGHRQLRTGSMPFHRQLSNGITSILMSLCGGQRIYDSQCGYRAIRLLKMRGITVESDGFQFESEMLLKLALSGASFAHVPIDTVYGAESSSINLVGDTIKFIKLILKSIWW